MKYGRVMDLRQPSFSSLPPFTLSELRLRSSVILLLWERVGFKTSKDILQSYMEEIFLSFISEFAKYGGRRE